MANVNTTAAMTSFIFRADLMEETLQYKKNRLLRSFLYTSYILVTCLPDNMHIYLPEAKDRFRKMSPRTMVIIAVHDRRQLGFSFF